MSPEIPAEESVSPRGVPASWPSVLRHRLAAASGSMVLASHHSSLALVSDTPWSGRSVRLSPRACKALRDLVLSLPLRLSLLGVYSSVYPGTAFLFSHTQEV